MLAYPINFEDDGRGMRATSPDFPELAVFGDYRESIFALAVQGLEDVIAARIHEQKDVPEPSKGDTYLVLPTLISVKVMLYREMREQGISKVELSRRLGWHLPQVFRVLDLQHGSHMDKMDAALAAVGKKLFVAVAATSDPVIETAGQEKEAVSTM